MNKKGFTLIEVLAVVGILAIIGVIVIPKILKVKEDNIKKLYEEQEDRLEEKAEEYMNDNYISPSLDSFVITKDQLIDGGYISELYDFKEKTNECEAYVYATHFTTTPKLTSYISCESYETPDYSLYLTLSEYSVTNLLTNGSFENEMSNWNWYKTTNQGSISENFSNTGSKSLKIYTNSSIEMAVRPALGISFLSEHIYYFSMSGYFSTITLPSLSTAAYFSGLLSCNMNLTILNKWQRCNKIFTSPSLQTVTDIRFGHVYANAANYTAYYDSFLLIDLTATFGSGNEPSQAWCDKNLDYFDGTKTLYLPSTT